MKFYLLTHLCANSWIPVLDGPKNRPLVVMVARDIELDDILKDYIDRECQDEKIEFEWKRLEINFN